MLSFFFFFFLCEEGCRIFFFFFQAEDGIRDLTVTGVQTCALPIWPGLDVTIVSGRAPEDLQSFVGGYGFGLIAEHGAAVCVPGGHEWERLDRNMNYAWMD